MCLLGRVKNPGSLEQLRSLGQTLPSSWSIYTLKCVPFSCVFEQPIQALSLSLLSHQLNRNSQLKPSSCSTHSLGCHHPPFHSVLHQQRHACRFFCGLDDATGLYLPCSHCIDASEEGNKPTSFLLLLLLLFLSPFLSSLDKMHSLPSMVIQWSIQIQQDNSKDWVVVDGIYTF